MPGAKKGRPQTREFMKLGAVTITRPDALNWAVNTKEKTLYYLDLPTAIKKAAEVAAESKATSAQEWLTEYDRIAGRLQTTIAHALKKFSAEGA